MTKQDFMEKLLEELYRYLSPEQYQLEGSVLLKNNDTKRYAILLKKIEGTVSPTIYLDNFYSEFEHGRTTISETASHIYEPVSYTHLMIIWSNSSVKRPRRLDLRYC